MPDVAKLDGDSLLPTYFPLVSYPLFTKGNARATELQNFCTNLNDKVRDSGNIMFQKSWGVR